MNRLSTGLRRQLFTKSPSASFIRKHPPISPFASVTRQYAQKYTGNMSTDPPRNEMVYLPGVLSPNRSFGVFRKVLHTGLYSQFVAMEVPVNGEIGDEVCTRVKISATFQCLTLCSQSETHRRSSPPLYLRQRQGYCGWKRTRSQAGRHGDRPGRHSAPVLECRLYSLGGGDNLLARRAPSSDCTSDQG